MSKSGPATEELRRQVEELAMAMAMQAAPAAPEAGWEEVARLQVTLENPTANSSLGRTGGQSAEHLAWVDGVFEHGHG
jgi:hypothetical protein